jgi:hypothetical protein
MNTTPGGFDKAPRPVGEGGLPAVLGEGADFESTAGIAEHLAAGGVKNPRRPGDWDLKGRLRRNLRKRGTTMHRREPGVIAAMRTRQSPKYRARR